MVPKSSQWTSKSTKQQLRLEFSPLDTLEYPSFHFSNRSLPRNLYDVSLEIRHPFYTTVSTVSKTSPRDHCRPPQQTLVAVVVVTR